MKILTAADSKALLRLASTLPKGSSERRTILSGVEMARVLSTRSLLRKLGKVSRLKAEKKDYDRINAMQRKSMRAGEVDAAKILQYARNMAKSIKDWGKAERRGTAAEMIGEAAVAALFFAQADALRGAGGKAKPTPKSRGPRQAPLVPEEAPKADYSGRLVHFAAIPMGSLNLRNGANKVFNYIDTWGGSDMTFIVCDRENNKKRVVLVGSRGNYVRRGQVIEVIADQTQRHLFMAVVVKEVSGNMDADLLEKTRRVVGKNSCLSYVLK